MEKITKEQIIEILNGYVFNIEDQAGNKLEVIEKDDFEKVANRILNRKTEKTIDEIYQEWSGEPSKINAWHPVHDSADVMDFAEFYYNQRMDENETK